MNPANLQLEGLYAAVAALMHALRDKGALSALEIDIALGAAEQKIATDPAQQNSPTRTGKQFVFRCVSSALPARLPPRANNLPFRLTTLVGQTKRDCIEMLQLS